MGTGSLLKFMPPATYADPRARGRQAAELLLERASAPASLPRRRVIAPVRLTERDSTPDASDA